MIHGERRHNRRQMKAPARYLVAGALLAATGVVSAEIMAKKVYPKWKHVAQSEVIRSHAYKVFEDSFLNYNPEVGVVRPLFTPIAPVEK